MDKIDVLVVGGGGREHALVWKIRQSPLVDKIYAALGNPGMAEDGAECIPIQADNIIGLRDFALEKAIGLTIVGPEVPLFGGIVDRFQERGLKIFGPTQAAAQIEHDKISAMEFMNRHGIPTGWHYAFNAHACFAFIKTCPWPVVVKNPDPAAGKGSFICKNYAEAEQALAAIQRQQEKAAPEYGARSESRFLAMEYLEGEEVSITAISDGEHLVYLPSSQDHKRLLDGDKGSMTGGMGAIAPAPFITPELQQEIHEQIILPTIRAMAEEGCVFKGVLYAGLILTKDGPKVLEFNARFGDPEAQVILPLLKTDLVELVLASIDGSLDKVQVEFYDRSAACVVLASDGYGYSDEFQIGFPITGTEFIQPMVEFFHAGTEIKDIKAEDKPIILRNQLVTAGGRVLGVTAVESTLPLALEMAYGAVSFINFRGMQFRRDIGQKALRHLAGQK